MEAPVGDEVLERYARERRRYRVVRYTHWNGGYPVHYHTVEYRKWFVWWEVDEVFSGDEEAARFIEWCILKGGPRKQVVA